MNILDRDFQNHWYVVQPFFSIRNEMEYDKAIAALNKLIDEVGTNEKHPLYELLDTLGTVQSICDYHLGNHFIIHPCFYIKYTRTR